MSRRMKEAVWRNAEVIVSGFAVPVVETSEYSDSTSDDSDPALGLRRCGLTNAAADTTGESFTPREKPEVVDFGVGRG